MSALVDRPREWHCGPRSLPVGERCHVMGILNVTPDSFSDGGLYLAAEAAIARGQAMAAEGADLLDVGGESSRPGAEPVSEAEELARVVPVVQALASSVPVPIAVDTTKAAVAAAALEAGAVIVNDISAMRADPAMAPLVADSGAGVVLMHMLGTPRTMQQDPHYGDVVAEVSSALAGWASAAELAGVAPACIALDPGIGFGKTLAHNLALLANLDRLDRLGYPLLVGPSRKSFMGTAFGLPVEDRLETTAGAVAWCAAAGVGVVRVHDVREMARVVRMVSAIREAVAPVVDTVLVQGLVVVGHHGVREQEREEGQEFVIDIEAGLDLGPAGRSDALGDTLDYSALRRRVAAIVAGERYHLIEALAERLAGVVLEDARVCRVAVQVGKPRVSAAVRIERAR